MDQYFMNYASLEQQRWMVADKVRTDAFAEAISEVVRPGDLVVDVGAGTGVLSILAAKAGARKVIAIERSNMANHAQELIQMNGCSDQVEIFNGDAKDFKINEKADVIISEWLGHMAYVEGMFRSVMQVRDTCLAADGKLLPSSVDLMLAPVDDTEFYQKHGPGFWEQNKIHNIDFSCFTKRELEMGHANQYHVPAKYLLADGITIHSLDTKQARPRDEWCTNSVEYKIQRDGTVNGFLGWFNTQLSPNVILDTAPCAPLTHWRQTYFPYHPIKVTAGQTLKVDYYTDEPFEGSRLMDIVLRVNQHEIKYIVD